MEDSKIRQMKGALLKCAEENKDKPTPTFYINVSRLCEDAEVRIRELEEEKCELLGLIQAKDKLIEKMKRCKNCEFSIPICDTHCQDCDEHYSNWRLAE